MKPIFVPHSDYAFDSVDEHTFYFTWNGNQSVGSILTIRDNSTNTVVYSEQQESLLLKHILPASILTNGTLYNASIQVIDRNNNTSEYSDIILFYCYTTPNFKMNINDNQVIQNSSYDVSIIYSQSENEELQQFKIELYGFDKSLIYTSGIKYNIDSVITLTGLLDNTTYYVKATGQTINHINIETDYIPIQVNYIAPDFYAYITVENRYEYGDIQFTSNLVSVEGHTYDNTEPIFIDNEYVDTINGSSILFDQNFNLSDRFTLRIIGKNTLLDTAFVILNNVENTVYLEMHVDENDMSYVSLISQNCNLTNIYFSNHVKLNEDCLFICYVRYEDKTFDIGLLRKG